MEKIFLDILRPDDWHVHLREGEMLSSVLPFTYENFGSALIMPNLDTPCLLYTSPSPRDDR